MTDSTAPSQSLSQRAMFAVFTRAIGVLFLGQACIELSSDVLGGMFGSAMSGGFLSSVLGRLAGYVAVGCFLVFGTDTVLRLFFREGSPGPRAPA